MLQKFKPFLRRLDLNQEIKVLENTIEEQAEFGKINNSERGLRRARRYINIEIPHNDFFKFKSLGSITLDWETLFANRLEKYLWGGYQIHGFASAMGTHSHFWKMYNDDSRFWKNNHQPEEEAIYKEFLPQLSYFQKSGHGDDGTFGCFYREKGVYPCKIYFYDKGVWFPMEVSLEEYYDKMIASNAVYYWQYFYIDPEIIVKKLGNFNPMFIESEAQYFLGPTGTFPDKFRDGTFKTSLDAVLYQMENIIQRFPKIFEGYDVSFFKERYDLLKDTYEDSIN